MKIPEYFKDEELACKCGCGVMPPESFVRKLYHIRLAINLPMIITSCARCRDYNRSIGGAGNSAHIPWQDRVLSFESGAADVVIVSPGHHKRHEMRLVRAAIDAGITGIGFKDNSFIHIDDAHASSAMWGYANT